MNKCRFCLSNNTEIFFERPDTYFWHGPDSDYFRHNLKPLRLQAEIMVCNSCGLIGIPVSEEIRSLLETYYTSSASVPGTIQGKDNKFARARTKEFFSAVRELGIERAPDNILEIGCQRGFLLNEFQKQGAKKVVGIEPGVVKAMVGEDGRKIEVRTGFLSPENLPEDDFDFIYSLQVFEHIENPADFLRILHSALRPGGQLMFAVPNEYYAMLSGNLGMFVFQHVNLFTPNGIKTLLEANGFETEKIISEKERPLYILAKKVDNRLRLGDPLLVEEHRDLLKQYAKKVEEILSRIDRDLQGKVGNAIGLWGCNAAMANLFSWRPEYVRVGMRVFDADPLKIGKAYGGVPGIVQGPDQTVGVEEIYIIPFMASNKIKQYLVKRVGDNIQYHCVYEGTKSQMGER